MKRILLLSLCIFSSAVFLSQAASVIDLSAQLTGDPRPGNPDNLIIDVSVVVDGTTPDVASWTVDLNSPLHSGIKLDSFFFNLNLLSGQSVTFGNFMPANSGKQWDGFSPASNAPGSGSADFDFGVGLTGAGNPSANEVDNAVILTFDLNLLGPGEFTAATFAGAGLASSSDALLGSMQLGAHVQALTATGGQSDSGFVAGNWPGTGTGGEVPEPGEWMLIFAGAGLIGIALRRRRTSKTA